MTTEENAALEDPLEVEEQAVMWCRRLAGNHLTEAQYDELQAWCALDAQNRVHLERAIAVWQAVGDSSASDDMIRLRGQALQDLRQARAKARMMKRARKHLDLRWVAGLAAAVVVVSVAGVTSWSHLTRPEVYQTALQERRVVALADGTSLSLDGNTTVKVRYERGQRILWLEKGRASFTVAKDPLRPFSVAVGQKTVVATGTQFSVERVSQQVRIVLYEGHVAVLGEDPKTGQNRMLRVGSQSSEQALRPGYELITDQASDKAYIGPVDPVRSLSWEGGQLVFDNEPLTLAVARINRYSAAQVSVGSLRRPAPMISGVYRAGDVRAFIEGVSAVHGLRYRPVAEGYVLEELAHSKQLKSGK